MSVKVENRKSQWREAKSRPGPPKAAFMVTGRGFWMLAGFETTPFSL